MHSFQGHCHIKPPKSWVIFLLLSIVQFSFLRNRKGILSTLQICAIGFDWQMLSGLFFYAISLQAFLSNLTTDSIYDVSIAAVVASHAHSGVLYEGPASIPGRVFVGRECDPHQGT